MKVVPVSMTVTMPSASADSMTGPEVSGVGVLPNVTTLARCRVTVCPENRVPVTVSEVQEPAEFEELAAFPAQTTSLTCQRARKPV